MPLIPTIVSRELAFDCEPFTYFWTSLSPAAWQHTIERGGLLQLLSVNILQLGKFIIEIVLT